MSSQGKTNGKPTANGSSHPAHTLEEDLVLLKQVISRQPSDESADVDLAALLHHLDTAHGVAEGVETRIDDIIGSLDTLLDALEKGSEKKEERAPSKADEGSDGQAAGSKGAPQP